MKFYKSKNTEKFPWRYFIETNFYIMNTTNRGLYRQSLRWIRRKQITEITPRDVRKLENLGFQIIKRY
jgi:hypothetical protein